MLDNCWNEMLVGWQLFWGQWKASWVWEWMYDEISIHVHLDLVTSSICPHTREYGKKNLLNIKAIRHHCVIFCTCIFFNILSDIISANLLSSHLSSSIVSDIRWNFEFRIMRINCDDKTGRSDAGKSDQKCLHSNAT